MKTQTIEVELPEGCRINSKGTVRSYDYGDILCFNLERIHPRRISFDEITDGTQNIDEDYYIKYKWWREVKETNEDPYLKLTKKDMLELIEHIKLGGQLNHKIAEFIDYYQPEPKLGLSVAEVKTIFGCDFELLVKVDKFIKENS